MNTCKKKVSVKDEIIQSFFKVRMKRNNDVKSIALVLSMLVAKLISQYVETNDLGSQ